MASSKQCDTCSRPSASIHCIGCDKYFCNRDFVGHRNVLSGEIEKIVENRNQVQEAINNSIQPGNAQHSPVIAEIDKWEKTIIKKVKDVAAKTRERAIQLLTSNQTKIQTEFKKFSQELAALRESEDFIEPDLDRLNQMINQFKLDIKQSTQPTIKLNTEQSDQVVWENSIYVDEIGRQQELKQQEMRRQQQEQEMKQQKELQQQQQEQEMKRQKELLQQQQQDMKRQQGLLQQQQQEMRRQKELLLQQQQQQQQQQRIGMFSKYRFLTKIL